MNIESGYIVEVAEYKEGISKSGAAYKSCKVILEREDRSQVMIECLNKFADEINQIDIGEWVNMHVNPTAYKYNERWYNDYRCTKIE